MLMRVSLYHKFHVRSNLNPNHKPDPNLICNSNLNLNPTPNRSSAPSSASSLSNFSVRVSSSGTTAETWKPLSIPLNGKPSKGLLIEEEQKDKYLREEEEKGKHTFLTSDTAFVDSHVFCPRVGMLENSMYSYMETFVIRCYEVGMNRTASIETMANLLQEVACNHAQSVGFSTDGFATTPSMRKRRLIWVTTRMHIEMDHYPVWGDELQVETWCQGEGKAGIRRDWLLKDVATNRIIGRATSTWVMMNQDSRRLSRITDDVRVEYEQYCPIAPRYAFPEENSSSLKKIPKLQDPPQHMRSGLMPRRGDLDMNQHVNNVTYIGWVLESMPPEILDTHQLHRITLDYRRECKHNDVVDSLATAETPYDDEHNNKQECRQIHTDKATVNGTVVNGTIVNGIKVNGSSGVLASRDLEYLHLVRLATNEVEINRGRTVWKTKS